MSRHLRLLDLLQDLRCRRRPVTAEALSEKLGVSARTLYRDINALRALGAEIDGEAGLGYVLKPGFTLPPLMLTSDEVEAILLGASWVAQRSDLGMESSARTAFAKILQAIPQAITEATEAPGLLVGAVRESIPTAIDPALIRKALRLEHKLKIAYADTGAAASERIIWPVAISVHEATQMLAAWCELRNDFRHFRLDRMHSAIILDAKTPRRRTDLFRAWRERERACIPDSVQERDRA